MPRFTDIGSYVAGIPTQDECGFLVLSIDELAARNVPHCVVIAWEAGAFLSTTQQGWSLADVVRAPPQQDERLLFIGSHGQYLEKDRDGERKGRLSGSGIAIDSRGAVAVRAGHWRQRLRGRRRPPGLSAGRRVRLAGAGAWIAGWR